MPPHSFASEQDFSGAYDEYADAIFRHCYLRTFQREQAKSLMAGSFMRLWEFIAEGNDVDSMQLMLYRSANELIAAGWVGGPEAEDDGQLDKEPREFEVLPVSLSPARRRDS